MNVLKWFDVVTVVYLSASLSLDCSAFVRVCGWGGVCMCVCIPIQVCRLFAVLNECYATLLLHNHSRAKVYRGFVSHFGSSVTVFIRLLSQTVQVLSGLGGVFFFYYFCFVWFLTQTPLTKKSFPFNRLLRFTLRSGTAASANINETIQDNNQKCAIAQWRVALFLKCATHTRHTPETGRWFL